MGLRLVFVADFDFESIVQVIVPDSEYLPGKSALVVAEYIYVCPSIVVREITQLDRRKKPAT